MALTKVGGGVLQQPIDVGIITATSGNFSGILTAGTISGTTGTFSGNLNVAGVLTYEDVTNVDSVGLITARSGIHVTGGSIGIGTNNPLSKIEVNAASSPHITSVLGQSDHITMTTGTTGSGFNVTTGNHFAINHQPFADRGGDSNLTERFRITSDGKIGINQNNPTTALLEIKNTGSSVQALDVYTNDVSTTPIAKFRSYDNTLGEVDRMVLLANGNIGIGTDNPGAKLTIYGTNAEDVIYISTGNNAGDTFANIRGDNESGIRIRGGGSYDGGTIELAGGLRNTDPGIIKFSTGTGVSPSERLRITSGGNVGIGSDNPRYGLDVYTNNILVSGSSAGNLILEDRGVGDSDRPFAVLASNGGNFTITNSNRNASGTTTGSVERLRVTSDGDILYGTSGSGVYNFTKACPASTSTDIFSLANSNGGHCCTVYLTTSTSGYSVSKIYQVACQYGASPTINSVADTGAYGGANFSLTGSNSQFTHTFAISQGSTASTVAVTVVVGHPHLDLTFTRL